MAETIAFWLHWTFRAVHTMPEFLGNNLTGAIFLFVGIIIEQFREFVALPAYAASATWREKLNLLGTFLMTHWKRTLKWSVILLAAFAIGHLLDLVRRDDTDARTEVASLTQALSTAAHNLTSAVAQTKAESNSKYQELDKSCSEMKGANKTLVDQNRSQNTLIAGCQEDAIKRLAPEPFKLTVLPLEKHLTGTDHEESYLLITNKEVTPMRVNIQCDVNVKTASGDPVGIESYAGGTQLVGAEAKVPLKYGQMLPPNGILMTYTMPAWTPTSPFRLRITYTGYKNAICNFLAR